MPKEMLWVEDECTRHTAGHEGLKEAWFRLFGTVYDESKATETIDHGDCIERKFGNISVWNVYGAWYEIRRNK